MLLAALVVDFDLYKYMLELEEPWAHIRVTTHKTRVGRISNEYINKKTGSVASGVSMSMVSVSAIGSIFRFEIEEIQIAAAQKTS